MNSIIKSRGRAMLASSGAADVKPVDLTPIMSQFSDDMDLDPSRIKDPLVRAKIEARIILREAQAEAEGIRQQAYDAGHREGLEQSALAAGELIQRLESDIRRLAADRVEVLDAVEPEMLKLCMEIVEKVIRHEARTDPRVVMRVLKSCLRRVKDTDQVCLHVSPEEVDAVKARRDELEGLAQGFGEIRIVADRRIAPGGCVVESSAGDFDADIKSQLTKIEDKLRETWENERNDQSAAQPGEVPAGDQPA